MLTFEKTLIIVTVMIVTFGGNIFANKMYYEGSTCSLTGGKLGVCTKLPECKSIDNGLKANTIAFRNIVQCSFIGNTIVICCPDRTPTASTPPKQHTHTSGGIVFEGNVKEKEINKAILPNVRTTTTRQPKVLFTVKNITITDDVDYIDLTKLLKKREKNLGLSSISPTSSSLQNHPSSSLKPKIIGKLTLDPKLLNPINFNKNIENINNFNRRPNTTANTLNNWNQGNLENNRNVNVRDRESEDSTEQNLDYQTMYLTTTIKSTIHDPWAAFEFRPSETTTPEPFSNWIQSSTQKTTEFSGEQRNPKTSFQSPGSLETQHHHIFNQPNNNEYVELTTRSTRHEEFNNNNNLDPWMNAALNSEINQQNINPDTHNHHTFNRPNNNINLESTTSSPGHEEFNNNNLDPWMKDALNSERNQQNINPDTHNHHAFNRPNNNINFESTTSSTRHEEFNNNNNLDPWMNAALNSERNQKNINPDTHNHHAFNRPNNNINFESTTSSTRHEEFNNNNLDPWMKDVLNSERNQQNINSNNNQNSDNWRWHTTTSTTTQRSFSTSNQNFLYPNSFSSSNSNNFSPNNNTTTSFLNSWMTDDIQFPTTTANPNSFTLLNKRPIWESKSDLDDEGDVYKNPSSRGNTNKATAACERYKKDLGPRLDFHIIDGEPTKPGEFPHMAGLGYREFDTDEYTWDCGGSLISDSYILTAAHCCDNPKRQPKLVRLGKTTVRNNDDGAEAVDVTINKITVHPEYRSFAKYNDIALIKLAKPVKFQNDVGPACLYTNKNDLAESVVLVATGWGVDNVEKRTESNFLLKVNLTSNPLNTCNQSYFEYGFTRQYSSGLKSGQMCAYDRRFDKDSCQGDSGGPLQLVDDSIHLSTIVGLTSFGIGCASAIPSVYTRVAYYIDWIESIVWP